MASDICSRLRGLQVGMPTAPDLGSICFSGRNLALEAISHQPLPWTFLEQPKLPLPLASAAPLGALRARGERILYLPGESGEKDPGRKQLTGGVPKSGKNTWGWLIFSSLRKLCPMSLWTSTPRKLCQRPNDARTAEARRDSDSAL